MTTRIELFKSPTICAKKMRSPAEASDPFELPAQKSEANLQAELGGTRRTQSVDAGSGSNPDILRSEVIGASDVARSPREIRAQDIRGKIEVSEVEDIEEADPGLDGDVFLDFVSPFEREIEILQPSQAYGAVDGRGQ